MNNDDYISITGVVATSPRAIITAEGLPITEFRLASTRRRYDKATNSWVDNGTNWYTVKTFRQRATNVGASISKGDRVFVSGKLVIRDWTSGERTGYEAMIEAGTLGHDLTFGTTLLTRNVWSGSEEGPDADAGSAAGPEPGDDSHHAAGSGHADGAEAASIGDGDRGRMGGEAHATAEFAPAERDAVSTPY